ncbi:MAG: HAMP domain-containing protein [Acidobacteria bacterium]|nr:HAMP domain-containing protein [Acidobacteriota bacterium]
MRISAKIAAGYAILIALIVAVLTYQISLFHQMQSINRDLSEIDFRSAIVSLQLVRDLDEVEEFTRKFFATGGDPGYASRLQGLRDAFSRRVQELESLPISEAERREADEVLRQWSEFFQMSSGQQERYLQMGVDEAETAIATQIARLTNLRNQADLLILATQQTIQNRVQQSAAAAKAAERISWIAAGAAFFLAVAVSFWIIRSIVVRLRALTEGTRAVAEGKFFYQLDSTGEDELAQLAAAFNVMTRRLSELENLKRDFVSHVSHELKTPLASMAETIRLLLEEIPGPLNAQQKRFLELNLQSSHRLSALIRNLLDQSRMDAGVMHYEMKQHDLAALVRTAVAEFEAPLREKAFRVDLQLPPEPVPVHCDADRMIQVLGNLIGNALKFSPRGSSLRLQLDRVSESPDNAPINWRGKIFRSPSDEGFALLRVADTGPGVPPEEKGKIFERFHQVRQRMNTSGQGAGLGLSITRTIVEAHGGAIWVEDNPGGGSIFHVVLAAAGAVAEPTSVRVSPPV